MSDYEYTDLPEGVRNKIKETVEKATEGLNIPEPLAHMLTQICFEMYKAGWREAHKATRFTLDAQEKLMR